MADASFVLPDRETLSARWRADAAAQARSGRSEVLRIDVTLTGHTLAEPEPGVTVLTLPFTGFADGPFFRGAIEPGACDVQRRRGGEIERLCADYWLTGRDFTGALCRVHVVNVDLGQGWKPTVTVTGGALAFLNGADCFTVMELRPVGPIVHIYTKL